MTHDFKLDDIPNLADLTELDLSRKDTLKNVDALSRCAHLQTLNLSRCYALENLNGLANCENILTDDTLAVLETLTGLELLDLHNGGLWEDEIPATLRDRPGLFCGAYPRPTRAEDFSAWTE